MKLTTDVSFMQSATSRTSRVFYELAARHGGYFTTGEASQVGISYRQLSYHVTSGALERASHGIYRLIDYPAHPHGDMIAVTLWAGPDSAISHDSALAIYGLASAMPPAIHLTAPPSFKGHRDAVRIHHEKLAPDERRLWDDVPVTTVERTLIDITRSGDRALLHDAVRESLERGLTTRKRLAHASAVGKIARASAEIWVCGCRPCGNPHERTHLCEPGGDASGPRTTTARS